MTDVYPCDKCGKEVETLYRHIENPYSTSPITMAICHKCHVKHGNGFVVFG